MLTLLSECTSERLSLHTCLASRRATPARPEGERARPSAERAGPALALSILWSMRLYGKAVATVLVRPYCIPLDCASQLSVSPTPSLWVVGVRPCASVRGREREAKIRAKIESINHNASIYPLLCVTYLSNTQDTPPQRLNATAHIRSQTHAVDFSRSVCL